MLAAQPKRAEVMQLEVVGFSAALAVLGRVRAASGIALKDLATDGRGHVPTALAHLAEPRTR